MALQTFTWNNGTNAHPVELSSQQLSNLLKVATNNSIQSDVRGHITTSSGQIAKYTKWQLEQKYGENLVIHAEPIEDAFSIFAVRGNINEGEQTEITVTGVSPSSVKFRLQHSFRNVYGIQQSAAQARIHMEGTTLVVDNPQENASWTDVVTIQAILSYEDWDAIDSENIQSCTVTITAKELTGISLTAPSQVTYGNIFESTVALLPSDNTKKNFVTLDATCTSNGTLTVRKPTVQGTTIYTVAPVEECSLTLTANAYMFGDLETIVFTSSQSGISSIRPSIVFTITADNTFSNISSANPKIRLQKINNNEEPIGNVVELTGTVVDSSLKYYYYNITADGTERYRVEIDGVVGYSTPSIEDVIPVSVITQVEAQYTVIQPDVYIVYSDKSIEKYADVLQRGSIQQGKTPIGVRILTALTDFVISFDNNFEPTEIDNDGSSRHAIADSNNSITFPKLWWNWEPAIQTDDEVVSINNEYYLANLHVERDTLNNIFFKARNKTLSIDNVSYTGYIGGKIQMEAMYDNFSKISTLFTLSNKQVFSNTIKTFLCYQHGQYGGSYIVYKKGDNSPSRESDTRTVNNIKYVIYTDKSYIVIPIYFIDF